MKKIKIKMADVISNKVMPHFGVGRYVADYVYKNKISLSDSFFLTFKVLWMEAEKMAETDGFASAKVKIYVAEKENALACLKMERRFFRKQMLKLRLKRLEMEKISFVEFLSFYITENRPAAKTTKQMIREIVEQQLENLKKEKKTFSIDEIMSLINLKEIEDKKSSDGFKYLERLVMIAKEKGYSKEEILDAWKCTEPDKETNPQHLNGVLKLLLSGKDYIISKTAEHYYRSLVEK